jgi:hypothetical protein
MHSLAGPHIAFHRTYVYCRLVASIRRLQYVLVDHRSRWESFGASATGKSSLVRPVAGFFTKHTGDTRADIMGGLGMESYPSASPFMAATRHERPMGCVFVLTAYTYSSAHCLPLVIKLSTHSIAQLCCTHRVSRLAGTPTIWVRSWQSTSKKRHTGAAPTPLFRRVRCS